MTQYHHILAAAAGGGMDGLTISVAAITAIGLALAGVLKAFRAGEKKGALTRTQVEPNPLPVAMVKDLATKEELAALEDRLIGEIKKLETALVGERGVARTANGNLHARIDKTSEGLAAVQATTTQINANLNRLMDLLMSGAIKHNPTPRTPR